MFSIQGAVTGYLGPAIVLPFHEFPAYAEIELEIVLLMALSGDELRKVGRIAIYPGGNGIKAVFRKVEFAV